MGNKFYKTKTFIIAICLGFCLSTTTVYAKTTVGDLIDRIKKTDQLQLKSRTSNTKTLRRANVQTINPKKLNSTIYPAGTNEAEYELILNREIKQLFLISKRLQTKSRRGVVWLRLAKAYTEKSALIEKKLQDRYDLNIQKYLSGQMSSKPRLNLSSAQFYNNKALELYLMYLKDNPNSSKTPEVLYYLGYNYLGIGKPNLAAQYFKKLVNSSTASTFKTEAAYSLGDFYFNKEDYKNALPLFQSVNRDRRSRMSLLGQYKLAWTYLKLGQFGQAKKEIVQVITRGFKADDRQKSAAAIARQAVIEVPTFYSYGGTPQEALRMIQTSIPKSSRKSVAEDISQIYVDQGNMQAAKMMYSYLAQIGGESSNSVSDYKIKLLTLSSAKGYSSEYERSLLSLFSKFNPKQFSKSQIETLKDMLGSHSINLHKKAQVSKARTDQIKALRFYKLYLNNFRGSSDYDQMAFYTAELLYDMSEFRESARYYSLLTKKKGPFQFKSRLNRVLALDRLIPETETLLKRAGKSTSFISYTEQEKLFTSASEKFVSSTPVNTEKRLEILYRLASLKYAHNDFKNSEVLFQKLIREYPGGKYAEFSANLILDSYNLRKDYKGLEKAGQLLMTQGSAIGSKTLGKVNDVVEKSKFNKALELLKTNPKMASSSFLRFSQEYPRSPLYTEALYNAALGYEKSGNMLSAVSLYQEVLNQPKLDQNVRILSLKYLGSSYEKMGYLKNAATSYDKLIDLAPKDPDAINAGFNAGLIWEAYGNLGLADRSFRKYLSSNPGEKLVLLKRLATMAENTGQKSRAQAYYSEILAQPNLSSQEYIFTNYKKAQLEPGMKQVYFSNMISKYSSNPSSESSGYVSEAYLLMSDQDLSQILNLRIPVEPTAQSQAVERKLKLVNEYNDKMRKVIALNHGPSIVTALANTGRAYLSLADSIKNAPLPEGLSVEEQGVYKSEIDKLVTPFFATANKSFKTAVEKGDRFKAYNLDYQLAKNKIGLSASGSSVYPSNDKVFSIKIYDKPDADTTDTRSLRALLNEGEITYLKRAQKALLGSASEKAFNEIAYYYYYQKKFGLSSYYLNKIKNPGPSVLNNKAILAIEQNQDELAEQILIKNAEENNLYLIGQINKCYLLNKNGGIKSCLVPLEIVSESLDLKSAEKIRVYHDQIRNNLAVSLAQNSEFNQAFDILKQLNLKDPANIIYLRNISNVTILGLKDKVKGAGYLRRYESLSNSAEDSKIISALKSLL